MKYYFIPSEENVTRIKILSVGDDVWKRTLSFNAINICLFFLTDKIKYNENSFVGIFA